MGTGFVDIEIVVYYDLYVCRVYQS